MKKIIISEVISQAWELTKKHWAVILACAIIIAVVNCFISTLMGAGSSIALQQIQNSQMTPEEQLLMLMQILSGSTGAIIVSSLVSILLYVGFYQTVLNCARGNGQFTLNAWKQPAALYVKILIAYIIVEFLYSVGFIFCILPRIYLAARLQFTIYYMLDHKDCDVLDGIKASWRMTENNAFTLFGLGCVYIGLAFLGLLCCCVGVYVSLIVVYFGSVVCYFTLAEGAKTEPKTEAEPKRGNDGYNKNEKA